MREKTRSSISSGLISAALGIVGLLILFNIKGALGFLADLAIVVIVLVGLIGTAFLGYFYWKSR